MYASKGGIKIDNLVRDRKTIGQKTKEKYQAAFRELYRQINESSESSTTNSIDIDGSGGSVEFNG